MGEKQQIYHEFFVINESELLQLVKYEPRKISNRSEFHEVRKLTNRRCNMLLRATTRPNLYFICFLFDVKREC